MTETFQTAYKQLNDAQRQAVDAIDGPVLVIAGPGTGKTQLLTTRIANILAKTDTLPENILCLTFTDSAAATMRERLVNLIGQAAYTVTISTYHAFGSELLHRYTDYFTDSADLQAADELLIDQVLRLVQAELPYSNHLKPAVFLRDIKTLISDFKRALLVPADIRLVVKGNAAFIQAATKLVQTHVGTMVRLDKKAVPQFEALLAASRSLPASKLPGGIIPLATLWQTELSESLQSVAATGKTTALTAWKNHWLAKDSHGKFIAAGAETVRKLQSAADIYERYLKTLHDRGLYDYDDMILQAIQGLSANSDLRYTLQERYQYVLLDEFQDTNGAQLRLVELLLDNPVHEERPNVLAVGDDDQAIYAFQGANYSHMLQFYHRYRDVLVVPLTVNYRSEPEILSLAQGIIRQISFGERLHHNFTAIDKTLTVAKKARLPAIVNRYEFRTDLSQNAWVAKRIQSLIAEGMKASEISVLATQHRYLEALVPFLHQLSIPLYYERRENVLDNAAIEQVISMSKLALALTAHDNATGNYLWPQILSYPFWKLATSQIWQLSWQVKEGRNWTEVLCDDAATKPIALFFIRLSLQVSHEPLEAMLDYFLGINALEMYEDGQPPYRSPYYEHYFGELPSGPTEGVSFWQLLSDLTVLRQHLRGYRSEDDSLLTLDDFIAFINAHQDAEIKILNTNPYQEAEDAVQLMTAYKAKGQEFQTVFIIGLTDEVWGSRARLQSSRISLPENMHFIRYAGANEAERLRLLYVALTRAKSQLYLTNYTSSFSGAALSRLKYLDETVTSEDTVHSPLLPPGHQTVHQLDIAPPELEELSVYWRHRHVASAKDPTLQALLQDRLRHFQLTASSLNRFTDTSRDGPVSFLLRDLLRFPSGSSVSGLYGDAIHETLHWLYCEVKTTGKLPSRSQTLAAFTKRLRAKRLGEQDTALLVERGSACLAAYLAQRAHTIHSEDSSEYNFRSEGAFVGAAHLGGKVDRLRVDRSAKTITIVDFKTGRSYRRWSSDIKLQTYKLQLYFYKLLIERSATFRNYTVVDAYLEFVEPDEEGNVTELHLDFNDETMQQLEKLIEAVWQHIMQLNFPVVGSYTPDAKGISQFQKDLANGLL
jgi:DNA helicase-2/ATP-dependent DNA helicase PcrA